MIDTHWPELQRRTLLVSIPFVIRVRLTIVLVVFEVDINLNLKDDAGYVRNVLDFLFNIDGGASP